MFGTIFHLCDKAANFISRIRTESSDEAATDLKYFQVEIMDWMSSETRKEQITGQKYYEGEQDISKAVRTAIGEGGRLITVNNLPNNRITDNQYAKAVDQKINYILGNPIVFHTDNEQYSERLNYIFDKHFLRTLKNVCKDSLNCGIGWLYVYYDGNGELCFKRFRPFEILPLWKDEEHNELDCVIRVYPVIKTERNIKKIINKAEIYSTNGIQRYIYDGGKLIDDMETPSSSYVQYSDGKSTQELNWDKIPIIPFKYNDEEIPLIRRCKELQDCINTTISDFANRMQEDNRNTILVLKNYDGENLGEFRRNLATYGAVKVRSVDGADGDVTALNVTVNAENYKSILSELKKALIENAKSFDSKDDRLSGSPNQMNIQSIYSDMDVDSKGMEVEYQSSLDKLLWFVDMHLINTGVGDFSAENVDITFNRSIIMNESESIANCQASLEMLSDETIISQHPWVDNPKEELERLKKQREQQEQEEAYNPFTEHLNIVSEEEQESGGINDR